MTKKNLPGEFEGCAGSLCFTLLVTLTLQKQ